MHVIPCLEQPHRRRRAGDRRVGLGVDHPGRLELHACASVAWSGIGVDDDAPGQGTRSGRAARHSRHRHPGRAVPGGLHDRHRLPAGRTAARGDHHVLEHVETAGEKADAVLHRAIPRRRAPEESVAGAASAGAAERAAAAGPRVARRAAWRSSTRATRPARAWSGHASSRCPSTCCPAAGRGRGRR